MKVCYLCGRNLSEGNFHKKSSAKDGLMPMCKPCNCARMHRHFMLNKTTSLASRKDWYEKHRERVTLLKKNWRNKNKHSQLYRLKRWCRTTLQRAVKNGTLLRGHCQYPRCENENATAHHWDYSKPLIVTWFCRKHHAIADRVYKLLTN